MANGVKQGKVFRISYDMDNSKWTVHIGAFSEEEALEELKRQLPKTPKRIEAVHQHCELDMLSAPMRKDMNFNKNQKIKKLKEYIKKLEAAKDLRTVKRDK